MTTFAEAVIAMESTFKAAWGVKSPVVYGGDAPEKPADDQAWVRFNIKHSDGGQATMGAPSANRFRQIGLIIIQIFSPEGKYAIRAKELANDAIEIYQGLQQSGITYQKVRPDEIGNDGHGYYQINVIAEFYYDTIT